MKTYKYKVVAVPNSIIHKSYDLGSYNRAVVSRETAIRAATKFQTRLKDCIVVVERQIFQGEVLIGFEVIFNATLAAKEKFAKCQLTAN